MSHERGRRVNTRPRSTANSRFHVGDTSGLRAPGSGPMALPPGTEGAVLCPHCETWVAAVQGGTRPRSHAYGGYKASVPSGHPPCAGSGQIDERVSRSDRELELELPTRSEDRARAEGLVTRRMIARALKADLREVRRWIKDEPDFPAPVGVLDRVGSPGRMQLLYRATDVIEWHRAEGRAS